MFPEICRKFFSVFHAYRIFYHNIGWLDNRLAFDMLLSGIPKIYEIFYKNFLRNSVLFFCKYSHCRTLQEWCEWVLVARVAFCPDIGIFVADKTQPRSIEHSWLCGPRLNSSLWDLHGTEFFEPVLSIAVCTIFLSRINVFCPSRNIIKKQLLFVTIATETRRSAQNQFFFFFVGFFFGRKKSTLTHVDAGRSRRSRFPRFLAVWKWVKILKKCKIAAKNLKFGKKWILPSQTPLGCAIVFFVYHLPFDFEYINNHWYIY